MKQRIVTIAAALIACAAAVTWVAQAAGPSPDSLPTVRAHTEDLAPTPHPSAAAVATPVPSKAAGLVSYAIPITELQGLPPDIASGSRLDLWVAWQPPITKRTELQPLLRGVILDKLVPPLLPEGPHSAILLVEGDQIPDLIWGDRFGALNVAVPDQVES